MKAYLAAIEGRDAEAACRLIGGEELDAMHCRAEPRVPDSRRVRIDSPVEVDGDREVESGPVSLFASATGPSHAEPTVFFTVSRARGRLRVTSVSRGARL